MGLWWLFQTKLCHYAYGCEERSLVCWRRKHWASLHPSGKAGKFVSETEVESSMVGADLCVDRAELPSEWHAKAGFLFIGNWRPVTIFWTRQQ